MASGRAPFGDGDADPGHFWQRSKLGSQLLHVDLWIGPSVPTQGQTMFGQALIDCENDTTDNSARNPTDTIIVGPASSLPVDQRRSLPAASAPS